MIFFTITGVLVWSLVAIVVGGWAFCHLVAKAALRRKARLTPLPTHNA
jgi:hypothetical protein